MIQKNIGTADRVLRAIIGALVFASIPFIDSGMLKMVGIMLGLFMMYQALMSWCALYALLGKNTCPVQKK